MIIDTETYMLPEANYLKPEAIKRQIVIGHTGTVGFNHYPKWTTRLGGKYKKTAAYSIDLDGNVFNHFNPLYSSNILGKADVDRKSIVILLENEGWLAKDTEKNQFINWLGHIYRNPDEVVEKRWRTYQYWAPYSEKQFESTIELVIKLCDEFFIPKFVIPHNTKIEGLDEFSGVLYRSNINKNYTDLNPSWDFEGFKNKIEYEE